MSEILELKDYKARRGITGTGQDAELEPALLAAEDAVVKYTGRDFTTQGKAEERVYTWDYTTILETDDFTSLQSIAVGGTVLRSTEYDVGPREGETFYWIDFSRYWQRSSFSAGQMGFMNNADVRYEERLLLNGGSGAAFTEVEIDATWGWEGGAPPSVQQAVVELVDAFKRSQGTAGDIQAESIADLSYVFQRTNNESATLLPPRVTQLLEPFRRVVVG